LLLPLAVCAIGCAGPGGQDPAQGAPVPEVYFELRPNAETGVHFSNASRERYENFFEFFAYVYNGGGIAVGDVNNDGLPDIYFTGNEVADRLYLNRGGFAFEDVTDKAIAAGQSGWHNGVSMIDINGDGWLDIYVCRGGWQDKDEDRANLLYVNQGAKGEGFVPSFAEQAAQYGLADDGYSMQAAFFDMDNDLDLDLYLTSRPDSFYLPLTLMAERMASPPEKNRDKLYRNDGGVFTEIGRQAGIINYGYSLGVTTADVNGDGYADVFVANDYSTPDHLYINQGDGTFRDEIRQSMNHISLFSMGTDISDMNNDGLEDILAMEMRPFDYVRSKVSMPSMDVAGFNAVVQAGMHKQYMHNMFYLNRGNGYFSEISQLAGISKTDWSWAVLSADFDADGRRDLFVTNGMRRDLFDGDVQLRLAQYVAENRSRFKTAADLFGPGFKGIVESYKPIKLSNFIFRNEGDLHFSDQSKAWGIDSASFSNGAAVADLDNDGDLDLVVNNIDGPAFIYENKSRGANSWLKATLKGPPGNAQGIGAKVWVHAGGKMSYQEQKLTRGYLSSQCPDLFFGLGSATSADSVLVVWPGGKYNKLVDIPARQAIQIAYQEAVGNYRPPAAAPPMFREATASLLKPPYRHRENEFDEFKDQVLLPHRFSTAGPRLSFADINGDGVEDFYIGGSEGMAGALYLSRGGAWAAVSQPAFAQDKAFEDMGSAFLDYDGDGDQDLFVASGGSAYPDGHDLYQDRLYRNDNGIFARVDLPENKYNSSVVVVDDFDGDGGPDIFVGGFVKPNRYPSASRSYVLKNDRGRFIDASQDWLGPEGQDLGILYAGLAMNIDENPRKALVLAGEWTPITVLGWDGSRFQDKTEACALSNTRGWWASLQQADIDGDGDQDLIAGNLGENYKFKISQGGEFKVFAGDFDRNGTNDIFLAKESEGKLLPIRGKECSSQQMPGIAQRFPSFQSFAQANLDEIVGPGLATSVKREADIFSSVILYNGGGTFSVERMPTEAQFSIVFGIAAADFNGDGKTDLFLAGNRFGTEVETTPSDASVGCLLINEGGRKFRSVPPGESGFYLNGDVKSLHLGRVGGKHALFSSENKGPLRVWVEAKEAN